MKKLLLLLFSLLCFLSCKNSSNTEYENFKSKYNDLKKEKEELEKRVEYGCKDIKRNYEYLIQEKINFEKEIQVLFNPENVHYYTDVRLTYPEKEEIFKLLYLNDFLVKLQDDELIVDVKQHFLDSSDEETEEIMSDINPYIGITIKVIDLNNDGKVEVFINLNNSFLYGNSGIEYIFSKNDNNNFFILAHYSGEADIVNFSKDTYLDLILGRSGVKVPVIKWERNKYKMDNEADYVSYEEGNVPETVSFEEFYRRQKLYNQQK